ncbi:MAG: PAS domain-containing protein [Pseudomonadota bacterium]
MDRFLDGVSLSPIRQVEAYWTALREDGGIPMRSQIDPRGMSATLEYTFILERIAPGMARFRIAGQHLCALAGMEVRGMPLTAFFTPVARPEISATLECIFDGPSVAEIDLNGEVARTGAPSASARMLMMPLRSDFGRVDRILGALMSTERGARAQTPVRFEIGSVRMQSLDGPEVDQHRAAWSVQDRDPATTPPGLAEPTVEFGPAPTPTAVPDTPDAGETPADLGSIRSMPVTTRVSDETPEPIDPRPDHHRFSRRRSGHRGADKHKPEVIEKAETPDRPKSGPTGVPYLRLVKSDDEI